MRILGTILSGMCLFAWVAYLSWPVSADGNMTPRPERPAELCQATAESAPAADIVPISENLEPSA